MSDAGRPLFAHYPRLAQRLAHRPLGEFPTPVRPMAQLADALGTTELYLKDDGVSGKLYGGNKVRKLEFLLADTLRAESSTVITFGYAGSNHAAATAVYAREVGLKVISMLLPQPNAAYVRRNLLIGLATGAELHEFANPTALSAAAALRIARGRLTGHAPSVIPPGGSSPLGTLGYVNAAFELDGQIARGEIPEPERIYLPLGSSGSVAGLLVGLAALGRRSRVIAVRVVHERWASERVVRQLFDRTTDLLGDTEASFRRLSFPDGQLDVRNDCFGEGYGQFTERGAEALRLARTCEGLTLDGTYTAKTLSACVADAREGRMHGPVLFWNTYNGRNVMPLIAGVEPVQLPERLRRYFSREVQPLDASP